MKLFPYRNSKHRRLDDLIIGKYNNEFNNNINNKSHDDELSEDNLHNTITDIQNSDYDSQKILGPKYNFQGSIGPEYNFYVSPNHNKFGVTNNVYSDIPYWYNFNKLSKGLPEYFSDSGNNIYQHNFHIVMYISYILYILGSLIIIIIIYKFIFNK